MNGEDIKPLKKFKEFFFVEFAIPILIDVFDDLEYIIR